MLSTFISLLFDLLLAFGLVGVVILVFGKRRQGRNSIPAGRDIPIWGNGELLPGIKGGVNMTCGMVLSLECSNLPKPFIKRLFFRPLRPFIVVHKKQNATWKVVCRTETVRHDVRHRFVTKCIVRFTNADDRHTAIRMEVYDDRSKIKTDKRNLIGSVQFSMDEILSEPLFQKQLELNSSRGADAGILWISGDPIRYGCSDPLASHRIRLKVKLSTEAKGSVRSFYVLSRLMESGEYTAVHRSEVISNNHAFRMMGRNAAAMTAGGEDTPLRIELYQHNGRANHIRLGHIQTSFKNMKDVVGTNQRLFWRPSVIPTRKKVINIKQAVLVDKAVGSRTSEFMVELR